MKYVEGLCRNEQHKVRSHIYVYDENGDLWPMCGWGWNRSDGDSFSIFRGHTSNRGTCKICQKRMEAGLPPNKKGGNHKTKWL